MERHIKNKKWKDFIEDFKKDPKKWYKSQLDDNWEFDEETQLKIVKNYTYDNNYDQFYFKFIKNPTKRVCIEAIKQQYGYAFKYINNPTEEMCLFAVKKNGALIQYINNPTEEMCLEAVKQDGYAIEFIKNPTKTSMYRSFKAKRM